MSPRASLFKLNCTWQLKDIDYKFICYQYYQLIVAPLNSNTQYYYYIRYKIILTI